MWCPRGDLNSCHECVVHGERCTRGCSTAGQTACPCTPVQTPAGSNARWCDHTCEQGAPTSSIRMIGHAAPAPASKSSCQPSAKPDRTPIRYSSGTAECGVITGMP
jgi:hypothetical protein